MGLYSATHFLLCLAKKEINSYNNLWFQRNAVDNFLKSQKSTEASIWGNEREIKIRGKQREEEKVKVRS